MFKTSNQLIFVNTNQYYIQLCSCLIIEYKSKNLNIIVINLPK